MRFLKKGIWTTLQDEGRTGHAAIGVSRSGAMDRFSQRMVNILLDKPDYSPVLEMHFPAPEIMFEEDCCFALYGADWGPQLNGRALLNGKAYEAKPGDILKFTRRYRGQRCYLGVSGEWDVKRWLDSCSPDPALKYPELPQSISLLNPRSLPFTKGILPPVAPEKISWVPEFEFEDLDAESLSLLESSTFAVSRESDRMGYRLNGPALKLANPREMISSAVGRGTIQLLPDGQLIVLMADAQTTGGYPRLGYISAVDLNHLSQYGPGDSLFFRMITEREARQALCEQEEYFKILRLTLHLYGH